jgi:hypothetical protein
MAGRQRTAAVTVNAAFLQEIKEVNEELWKLLDKLRDACRSVPDVRANRAHVAEDLAQLRDQLAMHFALEEAYGYFEDPLIVAPRLSDKAAPLRDEHPLLYATVSELVEYVEAEQYAGRLGEAAGTLVKRFQEFDSRIRRHELRENELIMDAYSSDIGVGD